MKAIEKKTKLSKNEIDMMGMVLNVHTKTIARKSSVKSLRNNDPGLKKIMATQRIDLPFKVNHRALSKESDSLFFSKELLIIQVSLFLLESSQVHKIFSENISLLPSIHQTTQHGYILSLCEIVKMDIVQRSKRLKYCTVVGLRNRNMTQMMMIFHTCL